MEYFLASILVVEMNFNGFVSLIWCSATPVGSCNIYNSKKSTLSIFSAIPFSMGLGLITLLRVAVCSSLIRGR
jgi:hypothetical protein